MYRFLSLIINIFELDMKKIVVLFLVFLSVKLVSQTDYSDRWEDLYSYTNVKDFVKIDDVIYAVTDNAVFVYNTQTNETAKISSIQGLSGETTSAIHYNVKNKRLVIGYEDGLVEVIDEKGKITTSPEITNFNQAGEKRINHIFEYNNKLYLATSFSIVVYDIDNLEFGDTYFIGLGSTDELINQITVFNDTIYAATKSGIYTAAVNNPNLIDFKNWTLQFTGNYTNVTVFNDQVFASKGNELFRIQGSVSSSVQTFTENIEGLKGGNTSLSIALKSKAVIFNTGLSQVAEVNRTSDFSFNLNEVLEENNQIYLATAKFGILKTELGALSTFEEVHPDGPMLNDIFSVEAHNNNVWVVYGGHTGTYAPLNRRVGYSRYTGEKWINTPFNSNQPPDLTSITIDKTKENRVFISTFGAASGANMNTPLTGGLLEVEDDKIKTFYNHLNSPLEDIEKDLPNFVTIRIGGTAFDNQGNLWVSNIRGTKKIKKLSPSGGWTEFDIESLVINNKALGMSDVAIDNSNTVWIATRSNGVYAFNERGNRKKSLTTEATRGSLPHIKVNTLAVDKNNRIWIGTLTGLVTFNNGTGIFDNNVNDANPIVILDEGIPKRLLGDQSINSIVVDGADNKWFGTETGGVLYTNPSGQKTLAQFNKDNSPLPTNKIKKISVDQETGKVYFATSKGMVAYNSKVAPFGEALEEVYAYPNPVLKKHDIVTIGGRNGTHLPKGTNVKILDTSGNLVYETNVVEGQQLGGGKAEWNKRNLAGTKVASGIYIVLLSNEDNTETASTKIAIVN